MNAPLYNAITQYKKNITSFHMPGHKFGQALNINQISLIDLDATEVPGLDHLYEAEGVILEAEKKMALAYGARDTIFVTNGSTSGIIASILAICKPGDTLIVARNCHHSVWSGLVLAGVRPVYINPSYHSEHHMVGGICPAVVEETLKQYPKAKGVLLVSPTYEGIVSDIKQIAQILHKHNKVLIVDEAHGAHFVWNEVFPTSAIQCGADIVIQSMHKTLPALTQSGLLHIGTERINKEVLIQRLQMVQTSSPSYIMMALMDYVRAYMEKHKEVVWAEYIERISMAREKLAKLQKLSMLSADNKNISDIYDTDISKIIIFTHNTNITGSELDNILRNQYEIQVEAATQTYITIISTIGDTSSDLDKLCQALIEIDLNLQFSISNCSDFDIMNVYHENKGIPRDVYFGDKQYVSVEECKGKISAINIMAYPPGIPIICIGEVFSEGTIDYIKNNAKNLLGIRHIENKIEVAVVNIFDDKCQEND